MGRVQTAIVNYLKENNGKALIDVAEFARNANASNVGVSAALHSLLDKGVIKKLLEGDTESSTEYTLIGDLPVATERATVRRRTNGLSGDLLQRAMEQVATLKATQDQLLSALQRIKLLEKESERLKQENADLKEELRTTDSQLADEQRKFLELLQSTERNSKTISKKIEFDGRGFQRTAGV